MVITLMPAQFAYAAEGDTAAPAEDGLPKKLAHFSFDNDIVDNTVDGTVSPENPAVPSDAGGNGKIVTATITGKGASIDKSYKKAGDGALKLDNPLLEKNKNGREQNKPRGEGRRAEERSVHSRHQSPLLQSRA